MTSASRRVVNHRHVSHACGGCLTVREAAPVLLGAASRCRPGRRTTRTSRSSGCPGQGRQMPCWRISSWLTARYHADEHLATDTLQWSQALAAAWDRPLLARSPLKGLPCAWWIARWQHWKPRHVASNIPRSPHAATLLTSPRMKRYRRSWSSCNASGMPSIAWCIAPESLPWARWKSRR